MRFTRITPLFLGLAMFTVLHGQEPEHVDLQIRRVVELYNQAVDNKDLESAETIALGAAKKYGENNSSVQLMLYGVSKARAKQQGAPEPALPFELGEKLRGLHELRRFAIAELPIWSKDGTKANEKLLRIYLRTEIGEQLDNAKLVIDSQGYLIVGGNWALQQSVSAALKSL